MINIAVYSKVKFPQMREMLMFALDSFADKQRQVEEWCSPTALHRFWDTALLHLGFLYDDIVIDEDTAEAIGYILVNEDEVEALGLLFKALDEVCQIIGEDQPDSAYISSPLWDKVVEAAQAALEIFLKNEEEAKKTSPKPWTGEDNWADT